MKSAVFVAFVATTAVLSSGVAFSSLPDDVPDGFECEDFVEGDRIEIHVEDAGAETRRELRVRAEADTRFRIEVEFRLEGNISDALTSATIEPQHGRGEEAPAERVDRVARVRVCGFVEFVDDGDGVLDPDDTILRDELVRFGEIDRSEADSEWIFSATTEDGGLRVTARVPMEPEASATLIDWKVEARRDCGANATHYAFLGDESDPVQDERFFSAECGALQVATGEV